MCIEGGSQLTDRSLLTNDVIQRRWTSFDDWLFFIHECETYPLTRSLVKGKIDRTLNVYTNWTEIL